MSFSECLNKVSLELPQEFEIGRKKPKPLNSSFLARSLKNRSIVVMVLFFLTAIFLSLFLASIPSMIDWESTAIYRLVWLQSEIKIEEVGNFFFFWYLYMPRVY